MTSRMQYMRLPAPSKTFHSPVLQSYPFRRPALRTWGWLIVPKYWTTPPVNNHSVVHNQHDRLQCSFKIMSAGVDSAQQHLVVFQGTTKKAQPLLQVIYEREVVITVPAGDLKGVLFALPGCLQLTTEWGFQSATCPSCHGGVLSSALEFNGCVKRKLDRDIYVEHPAPQIDLEALWLLLQHLKVPAWLC